MLPKLFPGTYNPVKIAIVQAAHRSLPVEILTPPDLQINIQIEETWHTTLENARIKPRVYCEVTNLPPPAIDGGLWIEKFPGEKQPGAKIKRIEMTDEDLLEHYIRELDKNNYKSINSHVRLWDRCVPGIAKYLLGGSKNQYSSVWLNCRTCRKLDKYWAKWHGFRIVAQDPRITLQKITKFLAAIARTRDANNIDIQISIALPEEFLGAGLQVARRIKQNPMPDCWN
jgi:hypothetical protein